MNNIFDVIIIGGGAAGMMAGITAGKSKKKVLLIEHGVSLGKKILATGNGRCNLTNLKMTDDCFCRENADFAMQVIKDFDEKAVMDFFMESGMLLHDRNGYVYPNSDQASQVNEILYQKLVSCGVKIATETNVVNLIKKDKNFVAKTDKGDFIGKALIIATGSKAYPKTGSDGSGYGFARKFGHTIKEVLPALTALKSDFKHLKMTSGVRCDGTVKLFVNGNMIIEERGEIQMTDYGISGIPVFQISRYAVQAVSAGKKVRCEIDFLPDYDSEFIKKMILQKSTNKNLVAEEVFTGLVNKKISNMLMKLCEIKSDAKVVSNKEISEFVKNIKNFKINITGYNSFDYGQVCQGGVVVDEIDPKTMESKKVKGLYFAGEIVDVDGICGGYNLQWAWSSGHKAGEVLGK